MGDPRYASGIKQGVLLSHGVGSWPAEIPGLGTMTFGTFGICVVCVRRQRNPEAPLDGGFLTYGDVHFCRAHAQQLAKKRAA